MENVPFSSDLFFVLNTARDVQKIQNRNVTNTNFDHFGSPKNLYVFCRTEMQHSKEFCFTIIVRLRF